MQRDVLRILVIDSLAGFDLIAQEFEKRKDKVLFSRVDTESDFISSLKVSIPDIVISKHLHPDFSGLRALQLAHNEGYKFPFILITDSEDQEVVQSCLKQGVDECIFKLNLSKLPMAVKNVLHQHETLLKKDELQKSLLKQNEQLKRINSDLDNLVYSVSHNLRGPLATIEGLINVAETDQNDKSYNAGFYFNLIKDRLDLIDQTIKQVLEYSRNSRTSLASENVNISKAIHEVWMSLSYLPLWKRAIFETDVDPTLSWAGDKHRLIVIIHNLLSNAVNFIDQSKSVNLVKVHAYEVESRLRIDIEDNGIGIQKDMMPKIYDMFYRASEQGEGAGLGLYVVKEAVKKLLGRIKIESEYRDGTSVYLNLPARYKSRQTIEELIVSA